MLLRNTAPQYLSFDISVSGAERQITHRDSEAGFLTSISVRLGSSCYCNCKAPKGMQEQPWMVTPQVHITFTMARLVARSKSEGVYV